MSSWHSLARSQAGVRFSFSHRAIAAVEQIKDNKGRLGVFWHTQGSGKSLSMVMFTEKVLRRMGGNWTINSR
jgi:type I site-specific restriction-modification system R (restriction) subunit